MRLKQELKDAQQALRENVAIIKQESDGPNTGLSLVDTTVKYTNKIQIEKRKLEAENAELKQKLEQITASIRNGETERDKFF
jgi:cell shape-determining protein MreC